jgi:hypothetical protein
MKKTAGMLMIVMKKAMINVWIRALGYNKMYAPITPEIAPEAPKVGPRSPALVVMLRMWMRPAARPHMR